MMRFFAALLVYAMHSRSPQGLQVGNSYIVILNYYSYIHSMRAFGIFSATIFCCILFAGVYGIVHDQLTFSLSSEYFTKYKYQQFGFEPEDFGGDRMTVAVIGFFATWWTGLIIGFFLGLAGFIYNTYAEMKKGIINGLVVVFVVTVFFGIAGFIRGKFFLSSHAMDDFMPGEVTDKASFVLVGSIHNYSYIGGAVGLILGIMYMFRLRRNAYKRTMRRL